jgi:hypothetical protein
MTDLRATAARTLASVSRAESAFGSRLAAQCPRNPITLCDGHGVFFMAASGQIRMAADTLRAAAWRFRRAVWPRSEDRCC